MRKQLGIASLLSASALVWVVAGAAGIAAAPTAITGPVSAVGPTSATVSGTVNPGGQSASWYVEYGTSTSYGSQSASASAGAGSANVAVSRALSGLASGTTYHYRVVATNGAGTSRGADGLFTTSAAPAVVTGAATSVTPTSATLNGSVDPNGRATTWFFEYGTSTSYGTRTAAKDAGSGGSAVAVSAPVANLAGGRVYHYRLVATSDAGTSRGADQTFSTTGAPVVTTDAASSVTPTSARLNGTITPNGQSTSWYFDYGTSTSYGARTAVKSAGSGTRATQVNASVTRLRTGVTYHYRLVATNASGTTVGRDRTFSTALQPVVRTDAARDATATTATLTGSVDPRTRATTWWFEYGTSTGYGSRTPSRSAGSGSARTVTAAVSGLRPGTTYHYRLVARNDAGTSRGANASFTTVGVTLTIPALRVVYGRGILLSGFVPTRRAGETVTVFAQPLGEGSPRSVATVLTAADGSWRWLAKPRIRTSYVAQWAGALSAASVVAVRPAVSLRRTASGPFSTRVRGAHSFAGRTVQLQWRSATGRWITIKRVRLNGRSAALIRATLPRGRSTLRIAMSVNQAGAGYLAGFSRLIVVRRA
jgi:phosphodiesterase/alkaline phosphatase D-like protein